MWHLLRAEGERESRNRGRESEGATACCPLEAYKVFMLQIVAYFVAYWRTLSSGKWQMGYDCTRAGVYRELLAPTLREAGAGCVARLSDAQTKHCANVGAA